MKKSIVEYGLYIKKYFTHPLRVGSFVPTSHKTAEFLAKHIKKNEKYIVELGGGTGSLTEGMLGAGIKPEKLICVEIDPNFCSFLRNKFSGLGLKIICADAKYLKNELSDDVLKNISTIVSSVPLLTLSKKARMEFIASTLELLDKNGQLIQVSYSPFSPIPYKQFNITMQRYGTIFRNFPPINIFGYKKKTKKEKIR